MFSIKLSLYMQIESTNIIHIKETTINISIQKINFNMSRTKRPQIQSKREKYLTFGEKKIKDVFLEYYTNTTFNLYKEEI